MSAAPTCLICGGALVAIANKEAPPWRCGQCAQAFYECELTAAARSSYRVAYRDFRHGSHQLRHQAAAEQATRRGS